VVQRLVLNEIPRTKFDKNVPFSVVTSLQKLMVLIVVLQKDDSLILVAFITGNSSLEPLIEGLYAQIHENLR
jgi:hypothetical protein